MATAKAAPSIEAAQAQKLAKLREPFPASEVKTRPGGRGKTLDYVPIEGYLERLLDVAPEYSWQAALTHFGSYWGENEKYTAVVVGQLTIGDKTATGVGAMENADPDMAVKSANSEAIKNAAKNGWGVSLELWSEEHREKLKGQRALLSGSESALKNAVFNLAKERLHVSDKDVRLAVSQIAECFGVTPGELADPAVCRRILEEAGKL